MNSQLIQDDLNRIENELTRINSELKQLPDFNIFISKNGNYHKWFYRKDGKQIYIAKEKRPLAEKLVKRKYLLAKQQDLIKTQTASKAYLKILKGSPNQVESLLAKSPEYLNLLSSQIKSLSQELTEWANSPYPKNPKYPENLIYETASGRYVRSKSEVIIDTALSMRNIPFHYEEELQLDLITYYPDFTLRHPVTGKKYYFEHFGKMDDEEYRSKTFHKLDDYIAHGIIPSVNLIMTFETKEHPLDFGMVNKVLDFYFGDV